VTPKCTNYVCFCQATPPGLVQLAARPCPVPVAGRPWWTLDDLHAAARAVFGLADNTQVGLRVSSVHS
jgi:hypothetical protein